MEVRLVAVHLKSSLEQLFGLSSAKPIALYEESKKWLQRLSFKMKLNLIPC
jgi:hypothetical protein